MKRNDPVLTPDLIRVLKIFLGSALGLVLALSFFNTYRADNTGTDRTFSVSDSNRLYFLNVRSIHYDREIRQDAHMTLFRHGKRVQSDSIPTLDPVIILNPLKDEAYIFFELANADWPIQIRTNSPGHGKALEFAGVNNLDHFEFFKKISDELKSETQFELVLGQKTIPLWTEEKELEVLKTISEDYFRLLDMPN